MTDLDKLIAAVEAGALKPVDLVILGPAEHAHAWGAFGGSLDAALRLHEALLPGWDVDLELRPLGATIESGLSDVLVYAPYSEEPDIRGCASTPARAWLLAVLRALKARA